MCAYVSTDVMHCRVFRKAGSIHPAIFNHEESLQLGPSRSRLCFKLHCSNKGYQLLTKQGWVEGQGLGANAGGMTQPFIPMHQSGAEAHLGLGCMLCNPILTGKGAEDELRVGCLISLMFPVHTQVWHTTGFSLLRFFLSLQIMVSMTECLRVLMLAVHLMWTW